jgi:hypothetical protein
MVESIEIRIVGSLQHEIRVVGSLQHEIRVVGFFQHEIRVVGFLQHEIRVVVTLSCCLLKCNAVCSAEVYGRFGGT